MKFPQEISLTCPIIVMRAGGLDGVALQVREYRYLLNKMNVSVKLIAGQVENGNGPIDPIGQRHRIISRLNFNHRDSKLLFANLFTHGPEKDGIDEISVQEWERLFHHHKNSIKEKLQKELKRIPFNTPVFVFNLLSLRHAHPAAAAALREIMTEMPERGFISHSADPDAERPEKIQRIKPELLKYISANYPATDDYCGGPYSLPNLYHIVLNPVQKGNFIDKYEIPKRQLFEISDFLDFKSKHPVINDSPGAIFMDFLSDCALKRQNGSFSYFRNHVDKRTVFFLSPVRPVYRKRLKESMLVAKLYGMSRGLNVAFVVTHPNKDDAPYFLDTINFAQTIDLPYFHLGETFSLNTLDDVYDYMAPLKTVGVVASSSGGWENALNEMARACIPFYMDMNLNSFKPLTETIGIETFGIDFSQFSPKIQNIEQHDGLKGAPVGEAAVKSLFDWLDHVLDHDKRHRLIRHNYRKAYKHLSHKAIRPKLMKAIVKIYRRHQIPEQLESFIDHYSAKR